MIYKAYAKINLSLKVVGKREDGYHELEMVVLPLALHDIIDISTSKTYTDTYITCDHPNLKSARLNICSKAVKKMRERFRFDEQFSIRIHKETPVEAGLGGGSSDAAATMLAINALLKLKLSQEELISIGKEVGADVPFFFVNTPSKVGGLGDVITPIKVKPNYIALLVKPVEGLPTKDVFDICDRFPRTRIDTELLIQALKEGDDDKVCEYCGNDLMPPAESLLPVIGEIYASLRKDGFPIVSMTGSGSTLFGLTRNAKMAKEAQRKYERMGYEVFLTKVLS